MRAQEFFELAANREIALLADGEGEGGAVLGDWRQEASELWRRFSEEDRTQIAEAMRRIARLQASALLDPDQQAQYRESVQANINGLEFMAAKYQFEVARFARRFVADMLIRVTEGLIDAAL